MQPIKLTRASQLLQAAEAAERHGLMAGRVCRKAGLPSLDYYSPDDLIPAQHFYDFMHRAAHSAGCRNLGVLAGGATDIANLGSFGALLASSMTTYDVLQACCKLMGLHTSAARYWLEESGDELWFCRSRFGSSDVPLEQSEQFMAMSMVQIVRMGAGQTWTPVKLRLQAHDVPDAEMREAFGDPEIAIGQAITAVAVPRAVLPQRLCGSRAARDRKAKAANATLARTAPAPDFVGTVRQVVATLMKGGHLRIQVMAEATGLSVRSLQRRLAEGGLSYSELVEQARYEKAALLLEEPGIRMTDIAFDLGYADSSHFTRAFRRWAGMTPRAYRDLQASNHSISAV